MSSNNKHEGVFTLQGFTPACLLYTSDAADERSSVDLGGRRIIKKKNTASLLRAGQPVYYTHLTMPTHSVVKTITVARYMK